jgi:hypothetical protein
MLVWPMRRATSPDCRNGPTRSATSTCSATRSTTRSFLGVAQLVQDAAAATQEFGALGGQADLAGRPVEQPDAEVLLQRSDMCAGRCPGNREFLRCLDKRAALGDPVEHAHCRELIHCLIVRESRT